MKSMRIGHNLYQETIHIFEMRSDRVSILYSCYRIFVFITLSFLLANSLDCLANIKNLKQDLLCNTKITFLGNNFFSSFKLRKKLFTLDDSGFLEPNLLLDDLVMLYKNHGFLEIKISFEELDDEIVFHIEEGFRARIDDIEVQGIIDSEFLPMVQSIFAELKQLNYFDMKLFNKLLAQSQEKFASFGYWNFGVKDYHLTLNKNYHYSNSSHIGRSCKILLEVDQGNQKLLKQIIIEKDSDLDIDLSDLKVPSFEQAIPFDVNLIDNYKNVILEALNSLNSDISVKHEIVVDEAKQSILCFRLTKKKLLYFGKIMINGCSRTLPEIVLKNLAFKEGDIWDFDKIEQSLKRLQELKIFKSISIIPKDFFENNSGKNITINVVEDNTFEAIARVGFAQTSENSLNPMFGYFSFPGISGLTYRIGGSFLWKNVSGLSDMFRLDLDITRFSTNCTASYKKPLDILLGLTFTSKIFNSQIGQPLPGAIMSSAETFDQPIKIATKPDLTFPTLDAAGLPIRLDLNQKAYSENHTGLMFNLDYENANFNSHLSMAFDYIGLSTLSPKIFKTLQLDSEFFKNAIPYFILEPSIVFNRFDNDNDPSKGFKTALSCKTMVPLNNISQSFVKLLFEHSHIMPITAHSSFILRFKTGYIFNQKLETIPPTERFYSGGLKSIRSYESNMVPPVGSLNFADKHFLVPIGSKFMVNLNSEWCCKLYNKLSGVIFNDIGLLNNNKFCDVSIHDIVGATGFGLRYSTPLGPVCFDLGFKWKRQNDDKLFNWHLTFGHSF